MHYFRHSYLKANKVIKTKGKVKLNKHITFESMLMLHTKNYQN